jgi:MFS family permease
MAAKHPEPTAQRGPARPFVQILVSPAAVGAVSAMALGQMVMVIVMVVASVYMQQQGHTLTGISLVISSHTLGMFAFSWVSGYLPDRSGRARVILVGTAMLALAFSWPAWSIPGYHVFSRRPCHERIREPPYFSMFGTRTASPPLDTGRRTPVTGS